MLQSKTLKIKRPTLTGLSMLVGVGVGVITVCYRLILEYAEHFVFWVIEMIKEQGIVVVGIWFLVLIILSMLVAKCVKLCKAISGSGIPQVKGVLQGCFDQKWLQTLCMKFIGGVLTAVGGLSVGREGPSIQLGACIGQGISKKAKVSNQESKFLIAGGASAGLAAAFNAPLAGVLFIFEEIFKYFSPLILLVSMSAAVIADFISKQVFGLNPIFNFNLSTFPLKSYGLLIVLGILVGVCGVVYNQTLLWIQQKYKLVTMLKGYTKFMIPFILAGILGIVCPLVLGGGHAIVEILNMDTALWMMMILVIIKFLFSLLCFGAGVPGGIFFPLLIIGGLIGAIFGKICILYLGVDPSLFYHFVIVAMAGYFTAIVRAPITGIVLIAEMTGSFINFLPLTVVSIIAYSVAEGLKSVPIYDSLLENQLAGQDLGIDHEEHEEKVMITAIVKHGSRMCGKEVREIEWPKRSLLFTVERMGNIMVPNGNMKIEVEDMLQVVTDLNNEWEARKQIEYWTKE